MFLCYLADAHSQIKVSIKHIEQENSLRLSITNTDTDTIMVSDSRHNRLSMVTISLYPQDGSKPYKDWHTLGTNSLHIIELSPNETYCYTYESLDSYKKGPYKKIELYYELVYRKGSLRNPTQKFHILKGTKTLY